MREEEVREWAEQVRVLTERVKRVEVRVLTERVKRAEAAEEGLSRDKAELVSENARLKATLQAAERRAHKWEAEAQKSLESDAAQKGQESEAHIRSVPGSPSPTRRSRFSAGFGEEGSLDDSMLAGEEDETVVKLESMVETLLALSEHESAKVHTRLVQDNAHLRDVLALLQQAEINAGGASNPIYHHEQKPGERSPYIRERPTSASVMPDRRPTSEDPGEVSRAVQTFSTPHWTRPLEPESAGLLNSAAKARPGLRFLTNSMDTPSAPAPPPPVSASMALSKVSTSTP
ncbi:hypothetical protein T484DRAFT_1780209 [Baffinella frigidus]|nr:hypothetical protein T484DRAFT_1780209 [Cryptophyta sp. CCMP2293]